MTDKLAEIISKYPPTIITPREFFIAWAGVLTLAYQGWGPTLFALKQEINQSVKGLKKENPGSKWSKTTLGVLRDGMQLSMAELHTMRDVCSKWNQAIPAQEYFEIDALTFITFQTRSLEQQLVSIDLPFNSKRARDTGLPVETVESIMAGFATENLASYLPNVNKPSNRESHYRTPHIESTLVFNLPKPSLQPDYLTGFTQAVDLALPGKYVWFSPESRHVTIRAVEGA